MFYLRFWRRIRILKSTYLNLSKKGFSLSIKGRILNITLGKHGIRLTLGIHKTGVSLTEYKSYKRI